MSSCEFGQGREKKGIKMAEPVSALEFLESQQPSFDIVEEYKFLKASRQSALCDHLFMERPERFRDTVALLWPNAQKKDIQHLERYLQRLKKRAH